ncbi:aspartate/glutamate racemase family protein [Paenirhodobacter enshiensis]|uniref:Aspartate/glutamate racemase family protein n=1 Tax=Paenirhodobacter enshiensis TaxID=1105367 RepID=A0A086XSQ9_9RHOB|nr:aspartate/glutamate racemase family protein [Paenirhodobacter enshiensis]KFI25059.1 hypothetical protein CG50_07160 [Paenirhodobacter enshiensis]
MTSQDARLSPLGIIMLDTAFERPAGDIGNRDSWPFEVLFETVTGATARRVVGGDDAELLDAFTAAGERLIARGARGLLTSCGFLAARQGVLSARLSVPLATSSLMQIPMVARCLPRGRRVGVLTYEATSLTAGHFTEVGADPETPRAGLPVDGALHALIEGGAPYDRAAIEAEVCAAVAGLLQTHPDIGAIVFECTNLPPFSGAVTRRFGLAVHDVISLGMWLHRGLAGAGYTAPGI